MNDETRKQRKIGIYLLPNLLTTAGLFAAFYAIVAGMRGAFAIAPIAIFIAMITDTLDGRVARLTNTESAFGAEYDSMSDMVAFGIAPALVVYSWSLHHLGKLGWLAAFIYTAGTALRLARFNTQVGTADKRYFQGLPSPAGAGIIASIVWLGNRTLLHSNVPHIIIAFITILVGILMVSNVRYYSFKELDLKGRVPFIAMILVVLIFVGISLDPPLVLFTAFSIYAISGPIITLIRLRKARRARKMK